MNHLLVEQAFKTPIGTVSCGLSSSSNEIDIIGRNAYDKGESIIYKTLAYRIELISFKIRLPLYNDQTVTDSKGWLWRIYKENRNIENIRLHCLLQDIETNVRFDGTDCGEHLDAIIVNSDDWTLHIGTEDGEVLNNRALNNDWMPVRFKDKLGWSDSFTSLCENGMITNIPELEKDEKIHFHYIASYDKYERYGVNSVNTWLAVDESKRKLENWIGIW